MQRRTTITLALAALLGAAVFVPDGASAQIGGGTSGPTGAGASHS